MNQPRYTRFIWFLSQIVIQTLGRYLPVRLSGTEHLPKDRPFILASNHISTLDPLLTCAYLIPQLKTILSPAATKGLWVGPLKWLLNRLGSFQIDRQDRRNLTSIRNILRTLAHRPILIYPEGGIVRGPERKRGKPGIGFVVAKAKVPVVPMLIQGSDQALRRRGRWIHRHRVTIRIGPPIDFADQQDSSDMEQITDRIMDEVFALANQGLVEKNGSRNQP